MKSLITDIQRFSLNDGDGIRTTVFFKGCNMRCSWCHNPETISSSSELMFYENKCIGCGKCFEVCPNMAHEIVDGKHVINRSLCTNCGACAQKCYAEALSMCGKYMTVEEIMREVCQDIHYYKNSGGGVTLSGGEVLCNKNFALELLKRCRGEGIHTAIESNISLPFKQISDLLNECDLVMCDIKLFDNELHKKYTGLTNEHVLENVKKIDSLNIPFIVRTPLIPSVTDSEENLYAIAQYIKEFKNLKRYELLNFNPLGTEKYKGLNRHNEFLAAGPLDEQELDKISVILKQTGVLFKII